MASYKYLGITEDSASSVTPESLNKIKAEMIKRVRSLCATKLNAKNLFKAINEHAISLINYHIGVLKLGPDDFVRIDDAVRSVLIEFKIHLQPGCKERLYLPRDQLGRGLQNVEHRSEHMLLQLRNDLELSKDISTRRAAILKVENECKTHLSLILSFLSAKYSMGDQVTRENLQSMHIKTLKSEIKNRKTHERLFRACTNEIVSVKDSSIWLKNGNNSARDEAAFCYIQDRNIFWGEKVLCPHCKTCTKTVDHLATKCDRMLGHDYMRRHNEAVKCLHLLISNKYGFKNAKKLRTHSVQEIIENENAEIRVDTTIRTDIKIQNNRPDIFIYDKKRKEILLIEVGITNQDLLNVVENEKMRKYDLLANELGLLYKCNTKIIPFVMTWEGVVTIYHKKYMRELGVPLNVEAYIQSRVLKKTLESISFDRRRNLVEGNDLEEEVEEAVKRLTSTEAGSPDLHIAKEIAE
jgi:hypothetical protein